MPTRVSSHRRPQRGSVLRVGLVICAAAACVATTMYIGFTIGSGEATPVQAPKPEPSMSRYLDTRAMAHKLDGSAAQCVSLTEVPSFRNGLASHATTCNLTTGSAELRVYDLPAMVDEELADHRTGVTTAADLAGENWVVELGSAPPELIRVFRERLGGQIYR